MVLLKCTHIKIFTFPFTHTVWSATNSCQPNLLPVPKGFYTILYSFPLSHIFSVYAHSSIKCTSHMWFTYLFFIPVATWQGKLFPCWRFQFLSAWKLSVLSLGILPLLKGSSLRWSLHVSICDAKDSSIESKWIKGAENSGRKATDETANMQKLKMDKEYSERVVFQSWLIGSSARYYTFTANFSFCLQWLKKVMHPKFGKWLLQDFCFLPQIQYFP